MFFLFKKRRSDEENNKLAVSIKDDLVKIFEKKGIDISQINIDIKSGSLNVQVYVGQQFGQTVKG